VGKRLACLQKIIWAKSDKGNFPKNGEQSSEHCSGERGEKVVGGREKFSIGFTFSSRDVPLRFSRSSFEILGKMEGKIVSVLHVERTN
jgi:hypothetical protein